MAGKTELESEGRRGRAGRWRPVGLKSRGLVEGATGPERGALAVLYAFTVLALAGFASFGLHPGLLARAPGGGLATEVYALAFGFFARGQIWLSGAVLGLILVRRAGWRWLPALGAVYALSLALELSGTALGLPFGEYAYSALLAPMWAGLVPVVIPLSWFTMAVPAYALAARAHAGESGRARVLRIALGSLLLLSWDLALDPAMSGATAYWRWGSPGPYYGMPLLNLAGWYLTGLLLMGALAALRAERWLAAVPRPVLLAYAGANLLLPLGMVAAAGMWGAVAATLAALAACGLWLRRRERAAVRRVLAFPRAERVSGREVRHA